MQRQFLRTLCCGDGSLKDQFAKGQINFQPERMSFIRWSILPLDLTFVQNVSIDSSFDNSGKAAACRSTNPFFKIGLNLWGDHHHRYHHSSTVGYPPHHLFIISIFYFFSFSRGIKRKREDEDEANESHPSNPLDHTLGLLEPKLELLEPQVELREEGLSGTEVKQEEVKKEEIKQEPVESLDEMNLAAMIRDETVKISVGNLLLQNSEDKRFSKIDPQLVKNAADARKRDYRWATKKDNLIFITWWLYFLVDIPLSENVLRFCFFSMQELLAQAAGGGMFSCGFCEFKTYCSKVK